ncbi:MAG: anthranilate phosphoribosyltransferase [Deltaproteobacteria bacterium]|nr:anthranilate phosphoribosyltransferase [Deltaproteobacteria bacterium]MBW2697722.1 anthranilate phosphoribosyltransferase [Deltaproteobacteria bacterium]
MRVREAIATAAAGREVPGELLEAAFGEIVTGGATPAQIAALLVALRLKGETVSEIVAAARALRAVASTAKPVDPRTVDTCGTGGTGRKTFSISTTSAFVVAGAGVPVAKHGNRAVTGTTGSFDTLEALGVRIDLPIEQCAEILADVGIAPFFARTAHPAFRHVGPVRAEIGIRTLLNCLGPLLNPVGARHQIVGVYADTLVEPLAAALGDLGARRALVVHGSDGLDELTTTGPSHAALVEGARVETWTVEPEALGLPLARSEDLTGGDAAENARLLRAILDGEKGPRRDIVLLNAAGALWAAEAVSGLEEGIEQAAVSIDSGAARGRLDALVRATSEVSVA